MTNFNSVNEVYSSLIKDLGVALRDALEEAKGVAIDYIITNWYSKYPEDGKENTYDRLDLMTDSLQSKYELRGNELVGYLYIKDDEAHPSSNSWNKQPVTYEYLYQWFSEYYNEKGILEYTQEQLDQAKTFVNIIRDTLKSKGYDFQ